MMHSSSPTPASLGLVTANQKSVFSSGTANFALGTVAAAVTFSTTSPAVVLDSPGTYLLLARAKMLYNAATFAAVRNSTLKLRRTNNSAADVSNASVSAKTDIITALTYTFQEQNWQSIYTTTAADDNIALFGSLDTVPTAGSLDVDQASIIAIRLQQ